MASPEEPWSEIEHPLVIKNKISKWEVLNYKKDDWCNFFQNKYLSFRQGDKTYREIPYWEQLCTVKELTLKTFFEISEQSQDSWLYLDYQHVKDILPNERQLHNAIQWSDLGLPHLSGQHSTLWIGNEGAHTPCHMDTYGCNFVAQIFGRKLWILMPPEEIENLGPVRVPYEESSIYSSYNFYTPNFDLTRIKRAYKIVLSPGDVLFVPKNWWHYVENLETAISFNVWLPLGSDHESRLEESLVRQYVLGTCKNMEPEEAKQLLNPNEFKLLEENESFELIKKCIENVKTFRQEKEPLRGKSKCIENEFSNALVQHDLLNFESYVNEKSKLHNYDPFTKRNSFDGSNDRVLLAKSLINLYCHPKIVAVIKDLLIKDRDAV